MKRPLICCIFFVISQRLKLMCRRFGTLCSVFIGVVNKKNKTWTRFLEYFYRQRFGSKEVCANWKEEAACPSRGTSCGGLRPQVETCSKTSTYGRNGPMSERGRGTMGCWCSNFCVSGGCLLF